MVVVRLVVCPNIRGCALGLYHECAIGIGLGLGLGWTRCLGVDGIQDAVR